MRSIALNLTDEQFLELFGISSGYFIGTSEDEDNPRTELMKQIRAQCIEKAAPEEYQAIMDQCEKVKEAIAKAI